MKLSIITINYNNLEGLKKTVESAKEQLFKDFEWLIIDGGSTDGSRDYIIENKNLFSFWCSEADKGIYNAMNKGIVRAKGDFCLFLNSGDFLHDKNTLMTMAAWLNSSEDIIIGRVIDKLGNSSIFPSNYSLYHLYYYSYPHQASFIRTSLFEKYGLYNESYKIVSDWEFFIKSVIHGNSSVSFVDIIVSDLQDGGISNNKDKLEEERYLLRSLYFSNRLLDDLQRSQSCTEILNASKLTNFLYRVLYRVADYINQNK